MLPYTQFDRAFELMRSGEAAKIVLDFKGDIANMNRAFEEKLRGDLDALKRAGTYKQLRHITTPMAPEVHMEEAGDVIVLSSNNYLGLADQAEVVEAGKRGLDNYGAGTASVRFICGTFDIHRTLEERIASFLGTEASLSYVACWNANTGLFATICGEGSAIVSDELNHASIIDGVRLASKARRERYKHSDMRELEEKLQAVSGCFPIVVVTDGVFSMEGDLAKLPEIVALARTYGAIVVVDDSHGTGVMGKTGRGTIEHYGLTGTGRRHYRHARQGARRRGGRVRRGQRGANRYRSFSVLARSCSRTHCRQRSRAARSRRSTISTRIPSSSSGCARIRSTFEPDSSESAIGRFPATARSFRSSSAKRRLPSR